MHDLNLICPFLNTPPSFAPFPPPHSAIRNIVARNRDLCPAFLDEGAERYINTAMSRFPTCADDAKAALRDLECKVELRELWTGLPGQEPKTQG